MTEHKNIQVALAAAQADMGKVVKGAVNPAFKSKYADLADVVSVAIPALTAHGIAMYHCMSRDDHGLVMRTVLTHGPSDTSISCDVPLIVEKNNMQGMKSATTYAKRIGLESLTGIAPEDDDGNAAAKAAPVELEAKAQSYMAAIENGIDYLAASESLADLRARWDNLPAGVRSDARVIAEKDGNKTRLQKPADDLGGDELPY